MSAEFIFMYNAIVEESSALDDRDKKCIIKYLKGKLSYKEFSFLGIVTTRGLNEIEFETRTFYKAVRRINDRCSELLSLSDDKDKDEDVKKLVRSYAEGAIKFKKFDRQLRNLEVVSSLV